jgi:hypothetical protein
MRSALLRSEIGKLTKESSNKGDIIFKLLYTSPPSGMLVDANKV